MQYKLIAALAIAATAHAQLLPSGAGTNSAAIISILATALPSSLVFEALTDPGAVSSEIASEFAAGETPTWFTALPSSIQTLLHPVSGAATGVSSLESSLQSSMSSAMSMGASSTSSSVILITGSATSSVTSGATSGSAASSSSASAASSSSSSTASSAGGAAIPTAAYGAGLAGAIGLIGLLAL